MLSEGKEKEEMKKKFTRKILGVSLSALTSMVVALPFFTTNVENVKANTEGCETYTNYYFYSHVSDLSTWDNETYPFTKTHASAFSDELPEGANIETAEYKWIDLKAGEEGWTIGKYWEKSFELTQNGLSANGAVEKEGNTWYYTHATGWYSADNAEIKETYTDPTVYDIDDVIENSYYHSVVSANLFEFKLREPDGGTIPGGLTRTWSTDYPDFVQTSRDLYENGVHPTERHIWYPALMQVKYSVCSGTQSQQQYNLIIKYVDNDTNVDLKNPVRVAYREGESYSAVCNEEFKDIGYTLTGTKSYSGTMGAEDKTVYCRYVKNSSSATPGTSDSKYKVTVNYLDKNTKKQIKSPYVYPTQYVTGQKYSASCDDAIGNNYVLAGYSGDLSGTIADKDVVINCLYTSESTKTSDIPIYIVWGIGGAALIYSIYYFRKYYKQPNNA